MHVMSLIKTVVVAPWVLRCASNSGVTGLGWLCVNLTMPVVVYIVNWKDCP